MIDPPRDPTQEPGPGPDPDPDSDATRDLARATDDSGLAEADAAFDTDDALDTDALLGTPRRRLRAAVALTLVVAIVIFGAIGGARLARIPVDEPPATVHPARLAAIDGNGSLATMDGSGGSTVAYPVPGVAFEFPVWSPDGTRVAAIGHGGDGVGLYVFAAPPAASPPASGAEPGVIYALANHPPFYLYWTPDSRNLTFLTTEPGGIALRIAPADGSAAASTIREGAPLYWDQVDPGRLIAHIGGSGPDAFLGELGIQDASDEATLIEPGSSSSPGDFRSPAVSRDGKYRAFVESADDGTQEIVIDARDGSTSHALAVAGPTALGFDPSGTSLAYVAPSDPAGEPSVLPVGPLRLADAASGSSRTLIDGSIVAFFWAPDGRSIATLALSDGGGGVEAATTTVVPAIARLTRPGVGSTVAVDAAAGFSLHLAFVDVATASVRAERDVRITDVFVNQILPFFDQYALSHRFWSADSSSLALPLVAAGGADQLVVIPADGSDPRPIPDRVIGFWSP